MSIIPNTRPKQSEEETRRIIEEHNIKDEVVLVGIRGYYLKTIGNPEKQDINVYDDAIFLVSPTAYATFNANTDPSFVKKNGKSLAMIKSGVYRFYKGKHKNSYWALRAHPEGVKIPCIRDGSESSAQYINIHKGGLSASPSVGVTWSEGCQTIPKTQWSAFINLIYAEMDRYGQETIPYILVENV